MAIAITDLFIYPVKSFRGIRLESSALDIRGLADDRRWMVIDENQKFVSQRTWPAMAKVHTQLTDSHLILHCEGEAFALDRTFRGAREAFSASIWADQVQVLDEGPAVSQWLSAKLGSPRTLRLVRLADSPRPMSKPQYLGAKTHTVFADMAPLLVVNRTSLDALNEALIAKSLAPVPMNRFRPNIVVEGIKAFSEHRIKGLKNDVMTLAFGYPCERCVMTTVDQELGLKHPDMEPYITLRSINAMPAYGSGEHVKPANPKAPAFGENAYLLGDDVVHVGLGDQLSVWHGDDR